MKKIVLSLMAGILMLSLAACGSQEKKDVEDFTNCVFVGDSVTEGFSFNEVLSEEQVLAGAGATVGFSFEDMDTLVARQPERVYILLGQCDLLMPVDDPLQLFHDDYKRYIQTLQERLPDCKIYLQSITPVTEEALETEPRYEQIETYNMEIAALAQEMKVSFIDLKPLIEAHTDLYAEDGIHFQKEFYPLWLDFLSEE